MGYLPGRVALAGGVGGVWAPNSSQQGLSVMMFVVREEREPRMLWGLHYARAGNKHLFFISLHFILPLCWATWLREGFYDTCRDQPASVWMKVRSWTRGGVPGPEAFVVPDLEGRDCTGGPG